MISIFFEKISEEEIKRALRGVIGIRNGNWLHTHDEIFEQFEKVKESYFDMKNDIIKRENGESIKKSKEFVKKYFLEYQNEFHEEFHEFFGDKINIIEGAIWHVADWIKGEKIQDICRGKATAIEKKKRIDLIEGNKYIYIMAAAIILESLIPQASE